MIGTHPIPSPIDACRARALTTRTHLAGLVVYSGSGDRRRSARRRRCRHRHPPLLCLLRLVSMWRPPSGLRGIDVAPSGGQRGIDVAPPGGQRGVDVNM